MIKALIKLMFFPLYLPLLIMWFFLGGLLGMKHSEYSVWRF